MPTSRSIATLNVHNDSDDSPAARLISATLRLWEQHGRAGISARQVSQHADTNPSQINYYFSSFEHLLSSAQLQAIARAKIWCDTQICALEALPRLGAPSPETIGKLLAVLIDDWCINQRELAFAWNECQLMAARDTAFVALSLRWQALWQSFWTAAAPLIGLSPYAELTRIFFSGEAFLHRICWNRPFDRACLDETCTSWAQMIMTGRAGPAPLRKAMIDQITALPPPLPPAGSPVERIAQAAADMIGREGAGALTHRAAAREANVNLGTVTYHLPTSGALIQAAWEQIYLRLVSEYKQADATHTAPLKRTDYMNDIIRHFSQRPQKAGNILAMEELLSAASRDKALSHAGATIRYSRGQTTYLSLTHLPSPLPPTDRQDATLFSGWLQGLGREIRLLNVDVAKTVAQQHLTHMLDVMRIPA